MSLLQKRSLLLVALGMYAVLAAVLIREATRHVPSESLDSSPPQPARPYKLERIASFQVENTLIQDFAFHRDGQLVVATAVIADSKAPGRLSGELRILDFPELTPRVTVETALLTTCLASGAKGRYIASSSFVMNAELPDGEVEIWDGKLGDIIHRVAWNPTDSGYTRATDPLTNRRMALTARHLGFSETGDTLCAYGPNGHEMCIVEGFRLGEPTVAWRSCKYNNPHIAVAQGHGLVAVAPGKVEILDLAMQKELGSLTHEYSRGTEFFWGPPFINTLSWSPDGRFLFTQSIEAYDFAVWDLATDTAVYREYRNVKWGPGMKEWIACGAVGPNALLLAVGLGRQRGRFPVLRAEAEEIRLYDLLGKCLSHTEELAGGPVPLDKMEFSPDGRYLLVHEGSSLRVFPFRRSERLPEYAKQSKLTVYEVR